MCHNTNSTNNPWVQICVDQNAVPNLLAQGDYLGNCIQPRLAFIDNSSNGYLNVYPNPTSGILNVSYHSPGNEKINIQLADATGRIVFTDQADVKTGDNSILVDLGAIATGLYNLSLSTNTGIHNISVII